MILDKLENLPFYAPMLFNLDAGLKAMKELPALEEGRYEFDGGHILVQTGKTKPLDEGGFETHVNYVDVQIMIKGSETIGWANRSDLSSPQPYMENKDAIYFMDGKLEHTMQITEGMCYIFFPHDAHKGGRHIDVQTEYLKVLIKLPFNQ